MFYLRNCKQFSSKLLSVFQFYYCLNLKCKFPHCSWKGKSITFKMSHASSIDFNIESQYNVKWSFLVLLQRLVIPGSGIFQIHIPIWIFLDCVIVIICVIKLLWFASIYFNIIVAPVSTTVITGCYFWMITFFRPFPLPPLPFIDISVICRIPRFYYDPSLLFGTGE